MGYRKWTPDEDKVLIEQVNRNPHLLKKAFEMAARLLERTPGACSQRWYIISQKDDTKTCFALVTSKSKSKNKKVPKKVEPQDKITCSIWRKLLTLLRLK